MELRSTIPTFPLYKFKLYRIYYRSESQSYVELVCDIIHRMGIALTNQDSSSLGNSTETTLIDSKGKAKKFEENVKFFKFKKCLYFKFVYYLSKNKIVEKILPQTTLIEVKF